MQSLSSSRDTFHMTRSDDVLRFKKSQPKRKNSVTDEPEAAGTAAEEPRARPLRRGRERPRRGRAGQGSDGGRGAVPCGAARLRDAGLRRTDRRARNAGTGVQRLRGRHYLQGFAGGHCVLQEARRERRSAETYQHACLGRSVVPARSRGGGVLLYFEGAEGPGDNKLSAEK